MERQVKEEIHKLGIKTGTQKPETIGNEENL
jgi:hypothetical protein